MSEQELAKKLESFNRYEDSVITGTLKEVKENLEVKLLRLRPNGIDCIKLNNSTIEEAKKIFKHWNADWIEL